MADVPYFDTWFKVAPADPDGYWLIPQKSSNHDEWAIMKLPNPVNEIDRLTARIEELESGAVLTHLNQAMASQVELTAKQAENIRTLVAEVKELESELAEAWQDSERLDWMLWNLDSLPAFPHFSDTRYVELCRAAVDKARGK